MLRIGFWNVDAQRGIDLTQRRIPTHATQLAGERSLDLLFLIECRIPADVLVRAFIGPGPAYALVDANDRFRVLARFDPSYMERLNVPVPSDRFDIWQLTLPLHEPVILGVVHGLDKRNNSDSKQELFLAHFASSIEYAEQTLGHDRTIVLGDFNANPFEPPVASATGMNAVMTRDVARAGSRSILGRTYRFFYNPMWNLFGDQHGRATPATYHYRGSDPHELYWHMLDQVLVRPSISDRLDMQSLDIVSTIAGIPLLRESGLPDRTSFSDHLPVVFGLDLPLNAPGGGAT